MQPLTDIKIQRAIIHSLNPHVPNGFKLSQTCLPIMTTDPVAKFLASHIQNGLGDLSLRSAKFDVGVNSQFDLYASVVSGNLSLVKGSQEIAKRLNAIMLNDKRISVCALAVCVFKATTAAGTAKYLAVLKLDQGEAFRQISSTDNRGRQYITFDSISDVMPTTRERMQKCAFIQSLTPRPNNFDLLILDRQQTAEPARFFAGDFLAATLADDSGSLTRKFYKAAMSGLNIVRPEISEGDAYILRAAIDAAVHSRSIVIEHWVQNLPTTPSAQEKLLRSIREVIPDGTIETDGNVAAELTKRRVFRGRHNLRMSFDSGGAADLVQSIKGKRDPNMGDYVEVILRVQDFREEGK